MNKTDYIILKSLAAWGKLLPIVLTVGICLSCADLTIRDEEEGRHPQPSAAFAGLCAENTSGQRIVKTLTLGESAASFESAFYLRSNLPFEKNGTVWLDFAGEDFVREYSQATKTEYKLLPAAFYKFKLGNSIEVSSGTVETERNVLTVSTKDMFGNVIAPGRYLLPVSGDAAGVCELNDKVFL